VRELELNTDMKSVTNLLDFIEKVRAALPHCNLCVWTSLGRRRPPLPMRPALCVRMSVCERE